MPTPSLNRAGRRIAGPALAAVAAVLLGMSVALPAAAGSTAVTIRNSLSSKTLTVAAGTTVTWRNADGERHRMRSRSGPVEFDSGDLDPGQSWSFTFRALGAYPYVDDRDRDAASYWGTVTVVARATTGSSSGGSAPPSGGSTPPSSGPTTTAISIVDRRFSPGTVTIDAGSSVRWRNADGRSHTVTARDGSFDSGVLSTGGTYTRRFTTTGTYRFLCAIHPEMTGTVTVRGARGGATSPATKPGPTPAPKAAAVAAPKPGGTNAAVRIVDFAFDSKTTTISAGSTVTWRNTGAAPHTVTSSAGAWDSGIVASGATYSRRFTAAGTYRYVCSFHPEMSGVIQVSAAGAEAPPPVVAAPTIGAGEPSPDAAGATDPASSPVAVALNRPDTGTTPAVEPAASVSASPSGTESAVRTLLVGVVWLVAFGVLGVAVRSTVRSR